MEPLKPSHTAPGVAGGPGATGSLRGIVVSTGVAAAALLAPALAAWLAGWRWTPGGDGAGRWVAAAVAVTDSAGFPLALAASVVLAAVFVLAARPACAREAIALVLLCATAIGCAVTFKSLLKNTLREPRPFVKWLEAQHSLPAGDFHALPRSARAEWLEARLADDSRVPDALRRHWKAETGYAFPSGHTAFAATWALLGVAVLWPRKRRALCVALVAWAMLVEATRLALGMHWPSDIVAGVALGWVIAACAAAFWQRARQNRLARGRQCLHL